MKLQLAANSVPPIMSSFQEYHYVAHPQMSTCQAHNCYCFYGRNQLDSFFSDSDSESTLSDYPEEETYWQIVKDNTDWAVKLHTTVFRHPRVLLAYFRYVALQNEIALPEETVDIPKFPPSVLRYIKSHHSLTNIPAEFQKEVDSLLYFLQAHS